jgi:N utilization substance protein B
MSNNSIWGRKRARRALVQAVYQWQMTGASATDVIGQFAGTDALKKADVEFFTESLRRVLRSHAELDAHFAPLLDRKVSELNKVELALLRLGTDELANRIEVPFKVVIDEYVELAKTFGAEESHKYINGVLDRLANALRPLETAAR